MTFHDFLIIFGVLPEILLDCWKKLAIVLEQICLSRSQNGPFFSVNADVEQKTQCTESNS